MRIDDMTQNHADWPSARPARGPERTNLLQIPDPGIAGQHELQPSRSRTRQTGESLDRAADILAPVQRPDIKQERLCECPSRRDSRRIGRLARPAR